MSEKSLAQEASELGFGPSVDRLEELARQPSMEALFSLFALEKHLRESDDHVGQAHLGDAWSTLHDMLTEDLKQRGYTLLEQGALFAAENARRANPPKVDEGL